MCVSGLICARKLDVGDVMDLYYACTAFVSTLVSCTMKYLVW